MVKIRATSREGRWKMEELKLTLSGEGEGRF